MDPVALKGIMLGQVGSMQISQGFLLGAAVLMETAIAMVLLSRALAYRANRWANIGAGLLHTAAVILSVFVGGTMPTPYYMFFGVIEIACTSLIVVSAWRWKPATSDRRIWYGLLAVFSVFGILYIDSRFYVPGDAVATAGRILAGERLFRLGIASFLAGQVCQLFLALALYKLFRSVNKGQARALAALNKFAPIILVRDPRRRNLLGSLAPSPDSWASCS